MWKKTEIDGGLLSRRDCYILADLVFEYLKEHVEDYDPDGDFHFEVNVEYVVKQETDDE